MGRERFTTILPHLVVSTPTLAAGDHVVSIEGRGLLLNGPPTPYTLSGNPAWLRVNF